MVENASTTDGLRFVDPSSTGSSRHGSALRVACTAVVRKVAVAHSSSMHDSVTAPHRSRGQHATLRAHNLESGDFLGRSD